MANMLHEETAKLTDHLSACPLLVLQMIAAKLPTFSQMQLSRCSSTLYFRLHHDEKPTLAATEKQQQATGRNMLIDTQSKELLISVTRSKYHQVYKILQKDGSLVLRKGYVTDLAGRRFINISAVDYAIWANDVGMLELLGNFIDNKQCLSAQHRPLQWRHHDQDQYHYSSHWQLDNLRNAYDVFLKACNRLNASNENDWQTLISYWLAIGREQKRMVVHMLREFLWLDWPRQQPPANLLLFSSPRERYANAPVLPFSLSKKSTFYNQRLVKVPHITVLYDSSTKIKRRIIQTDFVNNEHVALPMLYQAKQQQLANLLEAWHSNTCSPCASPT